MATPAAAATATAAAPAAHQLPEAAAKAQYPTAKLTKEAFDNLLKRIDYSVVQGIFLNISEDSKTATLKTRIIKTREYETVAASSWQDTLAPKFAEMFPDHSPAIRKKCLAIAGIYQRAMTVSPNKDSSLPYEFLLTLTTQYTLGIANGKIGTADGKIPADTFVAKLKAQLQPLVCKDNELDLAQAIKNPEAGEKILREFGIDLNADKFLCC